jgi:hypothetical protein
MTVPDGAGGMAVYTTNPDSAGSFVIDSLPAGIHAVRLIFIPEADTMLRYYTLLPRHKEAAEFRFSGSYFSSGSPGGGCSSPGVYVLRPDDAGVQSELDVEGAPVNYQAVDETIADEDVSRLVCASSSFQTDLFAIEDPTDTSCSILRVTVYSRCRKVQSQGSVKAVLHVSGSQYESTSQELTDSYAEYADSWMLNPSTGSNWQWLEIYDLQAGISLAGQNFNFPAYCTQVWVEVEYGS